MNKVISCLIIFTCMNTSAFALEKYTTQAIQWYKKSAAQGDADAQYALGRIYNYGKGVKENKAYAIQWYKKSATQGHSGAQYALGVIYDFGEGTKENNAQAVKWYKKSAIQGDITAQYFLGTMFENGEGVKQSNTEALNWYKKSASQGNASAQYAVGRMYDDGEGVKEDNVKAVEWYKKSALQGDSDAQYALGIMYEYAEGVTSNEKIASKNFVSASKGRNFTIQAGVFSSYKNAATLMNKIKRNKQYAYIHKDKKSNLYHVNTGTYSNHNEAKKHKLELQKNNRNNKYIVKKIK